jgi:hypothetical protein
MPFGGGEVMFDADAFPAREVQPWPPHNEC